MPHTFFKQKNLNDTFLRTNKNTCYKLSYILNNTFHLKKKFTISAVHPKKDHTHERVGEETRDEFWNETKSNMCDTFASHKYLYIYNMN